ncbi:MAG: Rv3235 family protein [Ornithinimicrobium sp.]
MSAQPTYPERSDVTQPHRPPPHQGKSAPQPVATPRLRVLPIPSLEPEPLTAREFAELAGSQRQGSGRYEQIELSVDFTSGEPDPLFAPQPTSSHELPQAATWSRQVLRVLLEVMDGSRPARQVSRWVTPAIHDRLARQGVVSRRRGGRAHRPNLVRSIHVGTPRDGIAEVAAVVVHNGRHRAVALQLTGTDGRWLVTALEVG